MRTALACLLICFPAACSQKDESEAKAKPPETGAADAAVESAKPAPPKPILVVAGWENMCAVISDGTARCWGDNNTGMFGVPDEVVAAPVTIPVKNVKKLTLDRGYMCALAGDGPWKCWGKGLDGMLDGVDKFESKEPIPITGAPNVAMMSAELDHICALTEAGGASCWGQGYHFWMDAKEKLTKPVELLQSGAAQVEVGGPMGCARMSDGTVQCWGKQDQRGQLGRGSEEPIEKDEAAAPVPGLTGVAQIALGASHACVLLGDGSVKCWGDNNDGQLGDDSYAHKPAPVAVVGLAEPAVEIATGSAHSCARLKSGKIACWGNNFRGELGNDKKDGQRAKAEIVAGIEGAKQLALSAGTTCVLLEDSVMCWGANEKGMVGTGSKDESVNKPAKVKL